VQFYLFSRLIISKWNGCIQALVNVWLYCLFYFLYLHYITYLLTYLHAVMAVVVRAEALRESEGSNKDLTRQVQELTLIRSDLQGERDALHSELSEATDANRDLGARLDAANAALQQLKQEMESRLRDAGEEMENLRYVASLYYLFIRLCFTIIE